MDPLKSPIAGLPRITTDTSAADAAVIQAKVDEFYKLFPPGSLIGDAQRRKDFLTEAEHVAKVTAILAATAELLPGTLGGLVASLLAGGEKSPETGKFVPKLPMAGNFAPSPIGYADPKSQGIKPNFYLPGGSSQFIPGFLDQFGLGLPQQRAEDAANDVAKMNAAARSALATAQQAIANESVETLTSIVKGPDPFSRAAIVQATSNVSADVLRIAAQQELLRRARAGGAELPGAVGGVVDAVEQSRAVAAGNLAQARQQAAQLDALQAQIQAQLVRSGAVRDPRAGILGNAIAAGSFYPESIEPVNDAARRNQAGATGIRKVLVSERADP